ncbi:MAG: hypothetical protein AAF202_00665 [Pseudomonadota bacterium]
MSETEDPKNIELESLQGADRIEKAVALHIHAINSPIMIIEGYLPESEGEPMSAKAIERLKKSLEKMKVITTDLKSELVHYRTHKP